MRCANACDRPSHCRDYRIRPLVAGVCSNREHCGDARLGSERGRIQRHRRHSRQRAILSDASGFPTSGARGLMASSACSFAADNGAARRRCARRIAPMQLSDVVAMRRKRRGSRSTQGASRDRPELERIRRARARECDGTARAPRGVSQRLRTRGWHRSARTSDARSMRTSARVGLGFLAKRLHDPLAEFPSSLARRGRCSHYTFGSQLLLFEIRSMRADELAPIYARRLSV